MGTTCSYRHAVLNNQILLYQTRLLCFFVTNFYQDRADANFLKHLVYIGEAETKDVLSEIPVLGKKFYQYKKTNFGHHPVLTKDSDWTFPKTYYKSICLTIAGFEFTLPDLLDSLTNLLQPSANLINTEIGAEEISTVPAQYSFFPDQKTIQDSITKYKNIPMSYFINESYFLYDKSDLVKETFITALQKKIFLYGSISYFNNKNRR